MMGWVRSFGLVVAATFAVGANPSTAEEIRVGGTGAALGLLQRLATSFKERYPADTLEVVPGLGSGGAIAAVSDKVIQVAISGRPLRDVERSGGLKSSPFVSTPYVFVTSHVNEQSVTSADIVGVYAGTVTKWQDGKEIKPILRPKSDAATPFLIKNFEGMQVAMDRLRTRADVPVAATDQDNVEMAEKVPNSIAGATLIQIFTEAPKLRRVSLDGEQGSVETMATGKYKLKMQLHLVTSAEPDGAAQRFLAFLRSGPAADIIRSSGAVPMIAPNAH